MKPFKEWVVSPLIVVSFIILLVCVVGVIYESSVALKSLSLSVELPKDDAVVVQEYDDVSDVGVAFDDEQEPVDIFSCVDACDGFAPGDGGLFHRCGNFDDDPCVEWGPVDVAACAVGDTACCYDYVYECFDGNRDGLRELSFAGICADGCTNGTCITKSDCVDSDGGENFEVSSVASAGGKQMWDICGGEGKYMPEGTLREGICRKDGNVGLVVYDCPFGCVDGACVS